VVSDLSHGNVEPISDALHKGTAHLPFPLQAVVLGQVQDELAAANDHFIRIRATGLDPAGSKNLRGQALE